MTTKHREWWGWDEDPALPEVPAWLVGRPELPEDFEQPWPGVEELIAEVERLTTEAAAAAASAAPATNATKPVESWRFADAGLLAELDAARADLARAHARWLGLLAEVDHRRVTEHEHAMPTASWLASGTSHSARAARSEVRLAGLARQFPRVGAALGAGRVSSEQATAILNGLAHLPDGLDPDQTAAVEADMVGYADEFGPTALRRLVNHAIEVVAPDIVEEHSRQALDRAERLQRAGRHVGWKTETDDGSLRFWGRLPALEGELFVQHLSALASSQRAADALMGVDTSHGQALADALALVVGHHSTCQGGPAKGGDHTRVIVTLTLDQLTQGTGAGTLVESNDPISVRRARHLACTAGLMPLVLDGDGLPLDLGRSQRLFTPHQRAALAVRDGGCTFPGCDRTPSDCQAHHATNPWHAGGRTDVADGTLLCAHHHQLVEPDPGKPPEDNWRITFDTRGRPVYHSPVRPNGQRITRQHQRFRM